MIREWLSPWYPIDREEDRGALLAELQREVDRSHLLCGVAAIAVARCQGSDDALFVLGDGRYAVVHLTWTGQRERSPWPETAVYADMETFVLERLWPDHRKWSRAEAT